MNNTINFCRYRSGFKTIRFFGLIFLMMAVISTAHAQFAVIPQPVSISSAKGIFVLNSQKVISVDKKSEAIGNYLQQYLNNTYQLNLKVKVYQHIPATASIKLFDTDNGAKPEGAYSLNVSTKSIAISGNGAGVFYGVQSLIQLMPELKAQALNIPGCRITDEPRFKWRGLSMDVCRHFFTVNEVKKYIDMMAHYKLNVFHWHLTDDEGWRIQINKYPKLTEVGAKITYWEKQGKFRKLDNLVDGGGPDGFYTQDDIRDVIKYAAARYVTILPEIEMPGHSEAAIFAYPQLGCQDSTGAKHRVRMLDPSEYTFKFYEDVLTEVIALFPNQYLHIGGDEAEMIDWLKSPTAVALMKKEHLKNEREIQSYFIKRIETFLISKNKKLIGWDEILEGGLAPSATVMSWQGEEGGIMAAKMHHDVVMTPLPYMYFDAPQAKAADEPIGWNDPVPWQMVYNYEPYPAALKPEEFHYILGAQANAWAEKIPNMKHLEYMIYPRVMAVAELTWTPKTDKNINRFEQSMYRQYHLFDLWNLNARLPSVKGMEDIYTTNNSWNANLTYPLKGAHIRYALNKKLPDTTLTSGTFPASIKTTFKDSVNIAVYITGASQKQERILQTATFKHVEVKPKEVKPEELKPGLAYDVYKTLVYNYMRLDTVKATATGVMLKDYAIPPYPGYTNTWVKFTGYLKIDSEGDYEIQQGFETSPVVLMDRAIILNIGRRQDVEPQSAHLHLLKGYYPVTGYYQASNQNNHLMPFTLKTDKGKSMELEGLIYH